VRVTLLVKTKRSVGTGMRIVLVVSRFGLVSTWFLKWRVIANLEFVEILRVGC